MKNTVTIGTDVDLDREVVLLPNGRRYTSADAEAEADAIEACHPLGVGRPSLDHGISPLVSFRTRTSVKQRLESIADATGRSQADIAREALERGLELIAA